MKKINREKFAPWRTVVGQLNLGRPPGQGGGEVLTFAFTFNGEAFTFGDVAFTYGAP